MGSLNTPLWLHENPRQIRTQIAGGDAGGILNCTQAFVRNAILVPARDGTLIDIKLASQIDEAQTAIFQEFCERHAGIVAQVTTSVNGFGWATL